MTLAAAFRGPKGGVLLCSDQEWNDDSGSKREINKNYRINLPQCSFFISGSGPGSSVIVAWDEIHRRLWDASNAGKDLLSEHREILREAVLEVFNQYDADFSYSPLSLLIMVAPRQPDRVPMMYYTEGKALIPAPHYHAVGAGKQIADYFADRLYDPDRMDKKTLVALAAFILREVSASSSGVGMGANMVFINEGEQAMHYITPGIIKEMQDGIPSLSDAVLSYWPGRLNFPEWYGS